MLRDILSGARGLAPVVLVILIAWALLSVMFLTGTLLAARSIDRSVAVIKPNVDQIGTDARFIREARTIRDTSTRINRAAAPLTGHLATTLEVASRGIDPKLKRILGKVGEINAVADEINGTVLQIGGTVDQIFGSASSINATVGSIGGSARTILGSAQTINRSARSILSSGNSILSRVNSIDRAVATIVAQRAAPIDETAKAINVDFDGIDEEVGQQGRGGPFASHIVGHANSIDCSLPIDLLGLGDLVNEILPATGRIGGERCIPR
ncbi:MAG TPA: methyl-accepting chemotaxis protein [Solirubrobacteraceae bacterium]|nr:methyl-accepting chemotaxis protein [Solirubrobacteraceae bacterium]